MNRAQLAAAGRAAWSVLRGLPLVAVLVLALAVAFGGWARSCSRADDAEAARALAAEKSAAREAKITTAAEVSRRDLERRLAEVARGNADLQLALARARAAIPGARVVGMVSGAVEGAAHGRPRPEEASPSPSGGAAGPSAAGGAAPAGGTCLLLDGDGLRLELEGAQLRGPAGGEYLVGTLAAVRLLDGELLLRRPLEADRVEMLTEQAPAEARPGRILGLGAGVSLARRWQVSGLFLSRPRSLPLVGRWRAWLFAAGGPGAKAGEVDVAGHAGVAGEF